MQLKARKVKREILDGVKPTKNLDGAKEAEVASKNTQEKVTAEETRVATSAAKRVTSQETAKILNRLEELPELRLAISADKRDTYPETAERKEAFRSQRLATSAAKKVICPENAHKVETLEEATNNATSAENTDTFPEIAVTTPTALSQREVHATTAEKKVICQETAKTKDLPVLMDQDQVEKVATTAVIMVTFPETALPRSKVEMTEDTEDTEARLATTAESQAICPETALTVDQDLKAREVATTVENKATFQEIALLRRRRDIE